MIEYCEICGRQLTDASGRWRMTLIDLGIHHFPAEQGLICSCCHNGILELIEDYSEKRKAERGTK